MFVPATPDVLTQGQIIHWLKSVFGGVAVAAAAILGIMNLIISYKAKHATKTPPPIVSSDVVVNTEATSTPK
jgi:hypothetical protein